MWNIFRTGSCVTLSKPYQLFCSVFNIQAVYISFRFISGCILVAILARFGLLCWSVGGSKVTQMNRWGHWHENKLVPKMSDCQIIHRACGHEGVRGRYTSPPARGMGRKEERRKRHSKIWWKRKSLHALDRWVGGFSVGCLHRQA